MSESQNQAPVPAIFAGIAKIQAGLARAGIAKDRRCSGGASFAYRSIESVYATLSPLLVDAGVVIYPACIEQAEPAVAGKMRLERALVTYRIQSTADGSFIEAQSLGEGADTSDKCAGKLLSYAYKNLIFTCFAVPLEGQPDVDAQALEPAAPFVDAALQQAAEAAAQGGMDQYKKFWASLKTAQRKQLSAAGLHEQLKAVAASSRSSES